MTDAPGPGPIRVLIADDQRVVRDGLSMLVALIDDVEVVGTACDGCPPISDLVKRFDAAGGRLLLCPICFNAKQLPADHIVSNADLGGTMQLWEWIGDGATTFSF